MTPLQNMVIHGISEDEELALTMHKIKSFFSSHLKLCNEDEDWVGY